MNIDDFEAPPCPDTWAEIITNIYNRQLELMARYKEIEKLPDPPVSIHHANGQRIIRDFAWRATEELTESYEAFLEFATSGEGEHEHHQYEEIGDALHFMVELLIFAGIPAQRIVEECPFPDNPAASNVDDISTVYWASVYELGLAMNFLRNKSWKTSHVPTDELRFRAQLMKAARAHFDLWCCVGLSSRALHDYYFRKAEVNAFRQRSAY